MKDLQDTYNEHLKRASREIESALRLIQSSELNTLERRKILRDLDPVLMLIKQSSRVKLVKEQNDETVRKVRGEKDGHKRGRNAN